MGLHNITAGKSDIISLLFYVFILLLVGRKSSTLVILLLLPAGGPSFIQPTCCFSPLTVNLILFFFFGITHFVLMQCMDS